MLDYVSACLCPSGQRVSCSTKYDFGLWREYEPIVRYIKRTPIPQTALPQPPQASNMSTPMR